MPPFKELKLYLAPQGKSNKKWALEVDDIERMPLDP